MKSSKYILVGFGFLSALNCFADEVKKAEVQKPRMQIVGKFDAGQPNVSIFKMYDASDDVICYALMPEVVTRKQTENGWTYDGNSIGSISCLKNRQAVIPIQQPQQIK